MTDTGRFTIGVFQDADWARRGVYALLSDGFVAESLTILGKESPGVVDLIETALGGRPDRVELKSIGLVVACGPLVKVLQGDEPVAVLRVVETGVALTEGAAAHVLA